MQRLALVQACLSENFQFRLGDPSNLGLTLTALYVLASLAMLRRLWVGGFSLPREGLLWGVCTALIVLLTLNKQLDLQQTVIWTGRCVARAEGWFDQRLVFQRAFGTVVLGLVAVGVLALIWSCRRAILANRALMLGMGLMLAFIVLQIVRFEQMSWGPMQTFVALRLHRAVEGVALGILIWAALRQRDVSALR